MWEQAQHVIASIQGSNTQAEALSQLGQALAQAQQWEQAQQIIASIQDSNWQAEALTNLANALAQSNEYGRLLSLLHYWWRYVKTHDEAMRLLALAYHFISHHSELGIAFYKAFAWVDDFLQG